METIDSEMFVLICNTNNEPLCAGRLDLFYINKLTNQLGICEFKRTAELYMDNVTLQLNLYAYGLYQSFGINVDNLICMRLRNELNEIVPIKLDKQIAIDAILAYL
jgi:hypothetical protein